jgi:hypothetical protein
VVCTLMTNFEAEAKADDYKQEILTRKGATTFT